MARTQINVAAADYNLFLNLMKGSGRWNNVSAPGPFDISTLEVQHLSDRELLDRYLRKALHDVGAPGPVRADPV